MRTYRINIVYRGIGKNYNETVWGIVEKVKS